MAACAHVCRLLRSAIDVGFVTPLAIRTPWFASKYGFEKPTTFARCAVIVVSSIAKSYGFLPPRRIVANGARRSVTLLLLIPSCFATSRASAYSKPDGFVSVVPDAWPFQNDGAGRSKPTMSLPACSVGAALDDVVVVGALLPPRRKRRGRRRALRSPAAGEDASTESS